jgi:uncharacterized protein YndB with AHSA1/START domain
MTASQTTPAAPERRQVGAMTLTLVSDTEVVLERIFDAPRELVFRAHASCEHIRHWWGRRVDSMPSCQMDFRPGGSWRFVNRDDEGNEFVFFGEYGTIVEPERIDWTFGFEGMEGEPGPESLTLEELDGGRRTLLRARSFLPSREARDALIASGMEHGAAETWDRLEEYLPSIA